MRELCHGFTRWLFPGRWLSANPCGVFGKLESVDGVAIEMSFVFSLSLQVKDGCLEIIGSRNNARYLTVLQKQPRQLQPSHAIKQHPSACLTMIVTSTNGGGCPGGPSATRRNRNFVCVPYVPRSKSAAGCLPCHDDRMSGLLRQLILPMTTVAYIWESFEVQDVHVVHAAENIAERDANPLRHRIRRKAAHDQLVRLQEPNNACNKPCDESVSPCQSLTESS
jgi:hypothetical protein